MAPDQPSVIQRLTQQFGDRFVEHLVRPTQLGPLDDPDGRAVLRSDCGHDVIEIQVAVRDGQVVDARFQARGCAHTLACASAATTCLSGKSLAEARRSAVADGISAELGGLDEGHLHCAGLAAAAAHAALDDAIHTRSDPWRKAYRR